MAKLKCKINDDRRKVKFECLRVGEVFIFIGAPFIKFDKSYFDGCDGYYNCINLENGQFGCLNDDALTTYVETAQLSIDI